MSYQYNQYDGMIEFTFIGTPEKFGEPLEGKHLHNSYLVLKFRPKCECGKEFRSSGKERALQQVAQHIEYKKYTDCKPTIEELVYDTIPEFVTVQQMFGTDANHKRNESLRHDMDTATQYEYPTVMSGYQITKGINVHATVIRKSPVRDVKSRKTGEGLKVCDVTLSDEYGDTIQMTLWNGQCEKFNLDDVLTIKNAFVKDAYQGGIELGTYKNASTIEVTGKSEESDEREVAED